MNRGQILKMAIQTKKEIRKYINNCKSLMNSCEVLEKSILIQNLLMEQEEYKKSDRIYIYVNYNREVITTDIIRKSLAVGKKVYVPKIQDNVIKFHEIHSIEDDLALGAYGILEPTYDSPDDLRDGLLVMPGLAFDMEFHRIGYGGGFYDKYLTLPNSHIKLALAYDFQIFDIITTDEFDVKVDAIITQDLVIRVSSDKCKNES